MSGTITIVLIPKPPPKKKKITRTKGNKKQTAPKLQLSREKPDANT